MQHRQQRCSGQRVMLRTRRYAQLSVDIAKGCHESGNVRAMRARGQQSEGRWLMSSDWGEFPGFQRQWCATHYSHAVVHCDALLTTHMQWCAVMHYSLFTCSDALLTIHMQWCAVMHYSLFACSDALLTIHMQWCTVMLYSLFTCSGAL